MFKQIVKKALTWYALAGAQVYDEDVYKQA